MYSILTYIWVIYGANVGKYSIHGAKIGQSIYSVCNIITYNTYIYHHIYLYTYIGFCVLGRSIRDALGVRLRLPSDATCFWVRREEHHRSDVQTMEGERVAQHAIGSHGAGTVMGQNGTKCSSHCFDLGKWVCLKIVYP